MKPLLALLLLTLGSAPALPAAPAPVPLDRVLLREGELRGRLPDGYVLDLGLPDGRSAWLAVTAQAAGPVTGLTFTFVRPTRDPALAARLARTVVRVGGACLTAAVPRALEPWLVARLNNEAAEAPAFPGLTLEVRSRLNMTSFEEELQLVLRRAPGTALPAPGCVLPEPPVQPA
ncbi:hypothetical protein [Deinococcus ficus]|uniref:Uncharacterized protein n=1 Tax=Deinococcus ficus TaxID=317577 RepID=A0A221STE1_9DEIO|nr:hypothetical protein [Deinococcus ficus]ASN79922.1 hypothetical protein DFI_01900 [Deinococcus ficus]